MSLVRYTHSDGSARSGYRLGSDILDLSDAVDTERWVPSQYFAAVSDQISSSRSQTSIAEIDLEVPTEPSKIVRLEGCYEHDVTDEGFNSHVENVDFNNMETPSLWVAPTSTLIPHGGTVTVPMQMTDIRPGVELGVIIDTSVYDLNPDEALDAIGGFTVCLDFAAHDDIPGLEGYRMFDTSLPCGPGIIEPETVDPEACAVGLRHNGEPVDVQSTTAFRFPLSEIISYVSKVMSLSPGDLITTGTPIRGAPSLESEDMVEGWIESVGTLRATVEWEQADE